MNTASTMNTMNTMNLERNGEKLRVVRVRVPLYRANKTRLYSYKPNMTMGLPDHLATAEYSNAPFKYFTLNKNELKAYTKYGMPFMKTWRPQEDLVLVDILHKPTRDALAKIIGSESLNVAFPLNGNTVSRISNENTRVYDDNVLRSICDLGLDGYYMKRLANNNKIVFHSEVGLCKRAFSKLRIEDIEKTLEPPRAPTRNYSHNSARKTRRSILNNSNNNNNNNNKGKGKGKTRKAPRLSLSKLSFNNL